MAAYARLAKDDEMISWATEIKVRAERRWGQLRLESEKAKGVRFNGRDDQGKPRRSHDETAEAPTLVELGISKSQSSRWQKIGAMSEEHFESAIAIAKEVAGEVTTAACSNT